MTVRFYLVNLRRSRCAQMVTLSLHPVLFDRRFPHRLKGTRPGMEGQPRPCDTLRLPTGEQFGREMQSRRGRRDGAGLSRINRLITLSIKHLGLATHVMRQGWFAQTREKLVEITFMMKF